MSSAGQVASKLTRQIGSYTFRRICPLVLATDDTGAIRQFAPQLRYKNAAMCKLNKYGAGSFCRFRIPPGISESGVYALLIADKALYVGECIHLSKRFNMGYGQISPRNCFVRGPSQNPSGPHFYFLVTSEPDSTMLPLARSVCNFIFWRGRRFTLASNG